MRIAQISPLFERCPPRLYGGTERIVSYLTEELVRQGHDVTLFASGNSITSARLEPSCERALRLDPRVADPIPDHLIMLDKVRKLADQFDVLHFHVDVLHYPIVREFADRTVTTVHGRLDLPELHKVHAAFPGFPLVSISNDQRKPMPPVNWAGTVYHGLRSICCVSIPRRRAVILHSLGEFRRRSDPTVRLKSRCARARG